MRSLKIFLRRVLLPIGLAALIAVIFRPVYFQNGNIDYLLMWICIGIPFGIRRMFLWLVPRRYDLAGILGIFALDIILGGVIGGFTLLFEIINGVWQTVSDS